MKRYLILVFALFLICITGSNYFSQTEKGKTYSGEYFGLTPPGNEPELFAPGFVTTGLFTRDITITPDGDEIYFCASTFGYNLIFFTKMVNGVWTEPCVAPFIKNYKYMFYEPHITYDGKRMLFLSTMPDTDGIEGDEDIWIVDKTSNGWGIPYNLGTPVNSSDEEYYPSTTKDGTLYFTRQKEGDQVGSIYRSRFIDGKYAEPELLNANVNCGTNRYNAYIQRDEKYIIVPAEGMPNSFGGTDYYIVFRDKNDNWSKPINMGIKINTKGSREYSASLSRDGKYLFFMSARVRTDLDESKFTLNYFLNLMTEPRNGNPSIYWISTEFIDDLCPEEFR
ncbi:MAG: hypothetical protein V1720_19145 [bacterium]